MVIGFPALTSLFIGGLQIDTYIGIALFIFLLLKQDCGAVAARRHKNRKMKQLL
jgi:hypothetical protein